MGPAEDTPTAPATISSGMRTSRFRRLAESQAFFISRLQHGTTVLSEQQEVLDLRPFLAACVGRNTEICANYGLLSPKKVLAPPGPVLR